MATEPLRRQPEPRGKPRDPARPKIWAEGDQRPPFNLPAFGRSGLYFSREAVAPLHAWAARTARRLAVSVKNGKGRIPEAKLGRAARFVPSHLRVAAWIKNGATVLSHASAVADPDVKRGNALVIEIEPHLWDIAETTPLAPSPPPEPSIPAPPSADPTPVVLAEPLPQPIEEDPLASIRDELAKDAPRGRRQKSRLWMPTGSAAPNAPPLPPGEIANGAIQVLGFMLGWLSSFAALPYGLARAGWLHFKGVDLRKIGLDD